MDCSGNSFSDKMTRQRSGLNPTYHNAWEYTRGRASSERRCITDNLGLRLVCFRNRMTCRKYRRLLGGSWNQNTQSIQRTSNIGVL
jgi:hypothetical protein